MLKRFVFSIASVLFINYAIFGLYLYMNQSRFIYFPDKQDFYECQNFNDYQKLSFNGTRFYFLNKSKDILIFYHGNAGSACDRSAFRTIFEKTNMSIAFVEYYGYSSDVRNPSKKFILEDVNNIEQFIKRNNFKTTTIAAESLGTGAASYQAHIGKVDKLLLLTPFSRMSAIAQDKYMIYPAALILTENYDNMEWLNKFRGRAVIIHGDKDSVIPMKLSRDLYNSLKTSSKEYIVVKGAGHNDLLLFENVNEKIIEFLTYY